VPILEPPEEYIYFGLGTRIGRGFSRSWDKYKGRQRFFSVQYHRATLDHSAELNDVAWDLDLPETKV
jgi:hypothetical protein